jgi:predicted ATPase
MFRLIAIKNNRPSKKEIQNDRRYASIYKTLEGESLFYFYKGYQIQGGSITQRPALPYNGNLYSDGEPSIDICAVVGKNGSGKSSLIELYLRLVNNLAYVCHRAINGGTQFNTQFVCDIFSTVFFDDTETKACHSIKQYGSILTYFVNGEKRFDYNFNKPIETPGFVEDTPPSPEVAKKCLQELCYTMVINYSAYSYNNNDYLPEWNTVFNNSSKNTRTEVERMEDRCWIDSLFHKNDGYQLPIVLNPFRENGMVDYNNERGLTQDRLYHLTLLQSTSIDTILNGSKVDRYVFDVDDDLNPVGNKMYASYKVLSQLMVLHAVKDIDSPDSYRKADEYGKNIINSWSRCFGVDLASYVVESKNENGIKRNPHVLQAINYIVYKTLKIPRVYPKYQFYNNIGKKQSNIEDLVKELFEDGSHITLKIRRCIAFIIFRHYKGEEVKVEQLQSAIKRKCNKKISLMKDARKTHPYERYDKLKEYVWKEDDFLPAASFKVNMYLKNGSEKGNGKISLSTMSSGERQFINSISTLAYHLSNIESVWNRVKQGSEEIAYKNVCVFFDEMDLYLHPEYQTKMVQLILDVIKGLHLNGIESIQIMCATHSPFILSDISHGSILYLENGKDYGSNSKMRTFAANIGDLLCHSFFMSDGLIGRFARDKVESLVNWLDPEVDVRNTESYQLWTEEEAEEFIKLVDDPFVSIQLRQMLKDFKIRKGVQG